jgi:anti-anti-sigma factor
MSDLARLSFERGPDDVLVARIEGEVDSSNAAGVGAQLIEEVSPDAVGLVLDLAAARYLDSAGIQVVIEVDEQLRARGKRACLVVPPGSPVADVLEVGGVGQLLSIAPDVDQAASSLRDRAPS